MPKLEELSSEDLINLIQTSTRPVAFVNDESKVDLNLSSIDIPVAVSFKDCTFKGTVDLSLAQTAATLDFSGSTFEKGLSLEGTRIGHHLILDGCTFKTSSEIALNTSRIDVKGDLLSRKDVKLHAQWNGEDMQIQGGIVAEGLTMEGEPRPTTRLNQVRVGGGITIKRGRFGKIELQSSRIGLELNVSQSQFSGEARFIGTHIGGQIDFEGVSFKKIYFDDVHVNNNLTFHAAKKGIPSEVDGEARFPGAFIGGQAAFIGVNFNDVIFSGAKIKGALFFQPLKKDHAQSILRDIPCSIKGRADFVGTRIGGQARFEVLHFKELAFDNAEIKGGLFVSGDSKSPCHIEGETSLRGIQIGSQAVFIGVTFNKLAFDVAEVSADLMMQPDNNGNPCRITGEARLHSATIGGSLDFKGVIFGGRVALDRTTIKKTLFFQPDNQGRPCVITGDARFIGTHISGQAVFEGAKFNSSVFFNNSYIGDKAIFKGVAFEGHVDFGGAQINKGITIRQHVNNPCYIEGITSFIDASIGGTAIFEGVSFKEKVTFDRADVKGGLFFRQDKEGNPCNISGEAQFSGTHVGGQINFLMASFEKEILFQGAHVNGEVNIIGATIPKLITNGAHFKKALVINASSKINDLVMKNTNIGTLNINWESISGNLELMGSEYTSLENKEALRNILLKKGVRERQPYEFLESYCRRIGEGDEANDVYFDWRCIVAPHMGLSFKFIGDRLLRWWAGYGVRPHRMLYWLLGFFIFGVCLFKCPVMIVPTEAGQIATNNIPSLLEAAWLSFVNLLPGIPSEYPEVVNHWRLTPAGLYIATGLRLLGWIVVSVGGLAATGLFSRYSP